MVIFYLTTNADKIGKKYHRIQNKISPGYNNENTISDIVKWGHDEIELRKIFQKRKETKLLVKRAGERQSKKKDTTYYLETFIAFYVNPFVKLLRL